MKSSAKCDVQKKKKQNNSIIIDDSQKVEATDQHVDGQTTNYLNIQWSTTGPFKRLKFQYMLQHA